MELLAYIRTLTDFSHESWEIFSQIGHEKDFNKSDNLLDAGKICNEVYFLSKGCVRIFYELDGREVNTNFIFENDFATNIKSLISGEISNYSIQAIEAVKTLEFSKNELLAAYQKSREIETFGRKLLEKLLATKEDHIDQFKLLSPQQRYNYLTIHHPEILKRISLTHIASYLGISRESLSRIRGRKS